MTPAGKLQGHLRKLVQGSGGQYRKVRYEGRRGCPDCLVWWEWPQIAFIEIKAEGDRYSKLQGDRYSKLQEREVERMQSAGIPVFTARTAEDVEKIVELVRKGVAT